MLFSEEQSLFPDSKVSKLFEAVSKRTGIIQNEIRLVFAGKELPENDPSKTLKDFGI